MLISFFIEINRLCFNIFLVNKVGLVGFDMYVLMDSGKYLFVYESYFLVFFRKISYVVRIVCMFFGEIVLEIKVLGWFLSFFLFKVIFDVVYCNYRF